MIVLAGVALVIVATGAHRWLSLDAVAMNKGRLEALVTDHFALTLLAFMAIYVLVTALSIPGALIMTLVGGMVFPFWIGPAYPLRAVTTSTIGAGNFFAPLIIAPLALGAMLWLARRKELARLGLAMFLCFLAPAFNIAAFPREQAVHDRYLYLPLLGFLILVVPPVLEWLAARANVAAYAVLCLLCVLLGEQTIRYNRAWLAPIPLFEWAVRTDPNSSLNYDSLAAEYTSAKRWDEALATYNQALSLKRNATSLVGRAEALTQLQRYDEAERDLLEVIQERVPSSAYTVYQAYERLAICYQQQRKLEQAVNSLQDGRKKLPQYAAAMTEKLAVILYQANRKDTALAQLEAAKPAARSELLPESRSVFFRLGSLYQEMGKLPEARAALQEYMALTNDAQDPATLQQRQQAMAILQKMAR